MAKQKTIWMVIDSNSSCMPSLKKVLFRSESLKECRAFREGMDDNFRITTQREVKRKKDEAEDD
jgi:hypothetical protein